MKLDELLDLLLEYKKKYPHRGVDVMGSIEVSLGDPSQVDFVDLSEKATIETIYPPGTK